MAHGHGKIAKRYARALFEATDSLQVETVSESLNVLSEVWLKTANLRTALLNPSLKSEQRIGLVKEVSAAVAPRNVSILNFVMLLVENKRLSLIPEIASQFSWMVDELKKALSLQISSAFEISQTEKEQYEERIRKDFGALAKITWSVNPQLIGGMVIKSGDRLIDSSIRGSLEKMTAQLLG